MPMDTESSYSSATPYMGNFSRPLSARHSKHPSYSRSSAPSGTQTLASNAAATSPTETQATSFLTDGSDVGQMSEILDVDRPGTSHSSALGASTIGSSHNHSPVTREKSSTSIPRSSGPDSYTNGYSAYHAGDLDHMIRKKNSRFRLKFWNKSKRPGEATP